MSKYFLARGMLPTTKHMMQRQDKGERLNEEEIFFGEMMRETLRFV
jgi:hypothetical protein